MERRRAEKQKRDQVHATQQKKKKKKKEAKTAIKHKMKFALNFALCTEK